MRKDICKDKDIRIRVTKYRLIHLCKDKEIRIGVSH